MITQQNLPRREVNLVALLAFIVGIGLAGLDLWVVEISSTPDSPFIGLFLGLLPSLTAILWVYPTVSWFYSRGVTWPSELHDARSEIAQLREDIKSLRRELGGSTAAENL
jgi:formate hydrogenlyase subunit 3/multisubunit Na+/H+ antiporter MnhD subunit